MKRADLYVAGVLALFSIYLMVKSAELPVGWIPEEGPGGGAFPFWLSVGMLICSILIFIRNLTGASIEGRSAEIFMDGEAIWLFGVAFVSLTVMIGLIHVVGVYVSMPLFMAFYIRFLGNHSWPVTLSVAVLSPVLTFTLFEKILIILLPKGVTETFFFIFF